MSEDDQSVGKLITRLVEMPEGKPFKTPLGNRIMRTSASQVKFGDGRIIDIPSEEEMAKIEAASRTETSKTSTVVRTRPRAASQSDASTSDAPALDRDNMDKRMTPAATISPNSSSEARATASESRLVGLDLSAPSTIMRTIKSVVAPTEPTPPKQPHRPPQLLPGEKELFTCYDVEYVVSDKLVHPGTLFVTNYQILFRSRDTRQSIREVCLVPLGKITRIEKVGGKKSSILSSALTRQLVLYCKDFHKAIIIRMPEANAGQRKQLFELLNKRAFPGQIVKVFAFAYSPPWSHPVKGPNSLLSSLLRSDINIGVNGWTLFSSDSEFKRIGVFERQLHGHPAWRWTDVNLRYALCRSYPERLVVPHAISDVQLQRVAQFRTQSRIPILSWIHKNGASITRCSQPKSGLVTARSQDDELLLSLIRETCEGNQNPLVIIDPRPRTNAEANRAVGGGIEKESNYAHTKVHFMGIANIHAVRESQQALAALCAQISPRTDGTWLSGVEGTGWLKHIKTILSASTLIIKCIHQHGASCLVHCSDGWDRTSQVVSLAMLCMDPYYRTITGFCILIEKEWVHAGHMFATRHGHASKNYSEDQRAPIFLQWLDCVYQIFKQYITSFEFNENLLLRISEEVTNCRFGTFLADHDSSMGDLSLSGRTVSLWTYIHHKDNYYRFTNPLYSPPVSYSTMASKSPTVIVPKCSIFALSFWSNSYLQGSSFRDRVLEMANERAFEMTCKVEDLELHIADLERELALLRGGPDPSVASLTDMSEMSDHDLDSLAPESISERFSSDNPPHSSVPPAQAATTAVRDSTDAALDTLVSDLAKVGSQRLGSQRYSITAQSSVASFNLASPTAHKAPPSMGKSSFKKTDGSPPTSPRHSGTPEPALTSSSSAVGAHGASLSATPSNEDDMLTDFWEEDLEWDDMTSDTPRVRGDPKWGSSMIMEDYQGSPTMSSSSLPNASFLKISAAAAPSTLGS